MFGMAAIVYAPVAFVLTVATVLAVVVPHSVALTFTFWFALCVERTPFSATALPYATVVGVAVSVSVVASVAAVAAPARTAAVPIAVRIFMA
jgi:hypothetical protein